MPSQVPKIDSATEDRLKASLSQISRLVDSGLLPNAAICKVASEQQIPAGQVQLLVQAYNTGRTQYQLHSSDNPLEKAATFPLADTEQILAELFPKEIKTAAAIYQEQVISDDFSCSPALLVSAHRYALQLPAALVKAASAAKPQPVESELAAYHRVGNQYERATKQAEDAKLIEIKLAYETARLIDQLDDYFRRPASLSFPAVRKNCEQMFGKAAQALFNELAEQHPQLGKQPHINHRVDWQAEPYSLIEVTLQKSAAYVAALAGLQAADAQLKTAQEAFFDPFEQRPVRAAAAVTTGSIWDRASSPTEKTAAGMGNTAVSFGAGAALSSAVKNLVETLMPPKEDMIRGQLNKLQDPVHEENIRSIRTQAMLSDLMKNDPVISGYQPEQVYDAYNRISEVVPQAAQSSMISRALVRRYLEQAQNIDPFEIDQMMNVENKLRSQQMPAGSPTKPVTIK